MTVRKDQPPRTIGEVLTGEVPTPEVVCPGCREPAHVDWPEGLTPGVGQIGAWHEACLEADQAEREEAEHRQRIKHLLDTSGMPPELRQKAAHATFSERLSGLATDWASGERKHVLLVGPVGVGKTTLAVRAGLLRIAKQGPVRYLKVARLVSLVGNGQHGHQQDAAAAILKGKHALILDDVDKARGTEYAAEQLLDGLDTRIERGAPLLITTNLTPAELANRWPEPYGESIASRLGGECLPVHMTGEDRRLA